MPVCQHCNAQVNPGARFCPVCGKPLTGEVVCPACGSRNNNGARYCVRCGIPLSGDAPQQPRPIRHAAPTRPAQAPAEATRINTAPQPLQAEVTVIDAVPAPPQPQVASDSKTAAAPQAAQQAYQAPYAPAPQTAGPTAQGAGGALKALRGILIALMSLSLLFLVYFLLSLALNSEQRGFYDYFLDQQTASTYTDVFGFTGQRAVYGTYAVRLLIWAGGSLAAAAVFFVGQMLAGRALRARERRNAP